MGPTVTRLVQDPLAGVLLDNWLYIVGIQGNTNFEFKYLGLQMARTWPLLTFFSSELKYFQWLTVVQPKEHLYFTYTKVV